MASGQETRLMRVLRLVAVIAAVPPLAYAAWYTSTLFSGVGIRRNFLWLPIPLFAFSVSLLLLWFGIYGADAIQRRRLSGAVLGGFLLGPMSFLVGFMGPLAFWPESNQGPLLGIFITGPLGFVLGCVVGGLLSELMARHGPHPG